MKSWAKRMVRQALQKQQQKLLKETWPEFISVLCLFEVAAGETIF
jgi:hypothetical protein